MFRGLVALLAGIVLLAVVGVAVADEIKGQITKIDGTKVTIDKDGKGTVLEAKDAKIKLGKKDGTLSDLKEKQMVTATYTTKDNVNTASEIKVGKAK